MWRCFYLFSVFALSLNVVKVRAIWDEENGLCPSVCTCRHEHLTEMALFKYINPEMEHHNSEAREYENNDVFYEDDINQVHNVVLKTAICILQTETDPEVLLKQMPSDLESLTLIRGFKAGNKTLKLSDLKILPRLKAVELQGTKSARKTGFFLCKIDTALPELKYLNLDYVLIENSNHKEESELESESGGEVVTFVYPQKIAGHSFTLLRKIEKNKILPYDEYIEQQEKNQLPIFTGFKSLVLLVIKRSELQSIHWEMFEGLRNLEYLILENDNLKYVPDFAFYGTPNLKVLSLARNKLLNIQVTNLAGLLKLEYLDLSRNNFSQLSELSLPPFPNLKLANFLNNPINIIYPNTFEVMNTTDSLVLGSEDIPLNLQKNCFVGLKLLKKLALKHLKIPILMKNIFTGMPNLIELSLSGNIPEIEFDAFVEVHNLQKLILKSSNIRNISMDAFIGLKSLKILDLSKNQLTYLAPGIFDDLHSLDELYLNDNNFTTLPKDVFNNFRPKLIRLNRNPWHCSCDLADWKPILVNKIKQIRMKACDSRHDKGIGCDIEDKFHFKYIYDNRVAPKCATPKKYKNLSVFPVMRRRLVCTDFKPRLKKKIAPENINNTTNATTAAPTYAPVKFVASEKIDKQKMKMRMHKKKLASKANQDIPMKISLFGNDEDNEVPSISQIADNLPPSFKVELKRGERFGPVAAPSKKMKPFLKHSNNII